ncbi:MAG: 30S ribosomal protein S3ae [Thermofilaceae archaeon]
MSQKTARQVRSKWETKKWFTVIAPSTFGYAELGLIPASEEKNIIGRTMEISFYDITKDISQLPIKLRFKIVKVSEDDKAYTQLKQIEITRDYIRSLVRRGTSRIDTIKDIETKDGAKLRIMCMIITQSRIKASQKKALRKIILNLLDEKISEMTFDELIQEIVLGKLTIELEIIAKKIYPIKKAEVRKVKILSQPINSN